MTSPSPLKLTLEPGEFDCQAELPYPDGTAARLNGRLRLSADGRPELALYGAIPAEFHINDSNGEMWQDFPQTSYRPSLQVDLVNGREVLLIDCKITFWIERALIVGTIAVVGMPGNFTGTDPWLFDGLQLQITGCDAVIAPSPLAQVKQPQTKEINKPFEWAVIERLPRETVSADNDAEVSSGWHNSFSFPNGYQHRVAFSPVIDVNLQQPVDLPTLAKQWIHPLHRIIGLSTGRDEKITYLGLRPTGNEDRVLQAFGVNLVQQPYAADHNEIMRTRRAFQCYGDDNPTLLQLCRGWQQAEAGDHPLIATLAAFMFLPRLQPRPRFLLLVQALEGMHGHEHAGAIADREEQHLKERGAALAAVKTADFDPAVRKFIKDNLSKRPITSLEPALRSAVETLPDDLGPRLADLALVDEVKASDDKVKNWAEALRVVRNGLSHGSRTWPAHLLAPAADLLDQIARAHLMRVIGCTTNALHTVLNPDA
ncbi:hypothetical protein GCM10009593_25450 [Microlunatus antarcticus]|nr:hypothetical protein [Microlunatus antarcticus]